MSEAVQPKVYTIAPERPFLATLADGLLGMTAGDPLRLSRITVLLPTRRAVRALRVHFYARRPKDGRRGRPSCCRACGRSAISIRTN